MLLAAFPVRLHFDAFRVLARLVERLIRVDAHARGDGVHEQAGRPEAPALSADVGRGVDRKLAGEILARADEVEIALLPDFDFHGSTSLETDYSSGRATERGGWPAATRWMFSQANLARRNHPS